MNHINDDDNFNDLFRARFQDFEDNNVSEDNWAAIQSAMTQEPSFWQRNKRKSGILVLLLFISTCAYPLLHTSVAPVCEELITIKTNNTAKKSTIVESADPLSNLTKNATSAPISNLKNVIHVNEIKKINTPIKAQLNTNATSNFNTNLITNKNVVTNNNNALINNENNLKSNNSINNLTLNSAINTEIKNTDLITNKNTINNNNDLAINNSTVNETIENKDLTTNENEINNDNKVVINNPKINDAIENKDLINETKNPITNKSITNNPLKKRHFYFLMTPQYSFFKFSPNTADKIYLSNFELTNSLSIKRLGMQLEAGMSYALSKKWQVNIGLNAQLIRKNINYSTRTNVLDSFKIEALNASNIRIERVADLNKIQEENNYYSIGVNTDLVYQINNKKGGFNWFLSSGFGLNQLINQTQSSAITVNAAFGFKHTLNNQFDIIVAPKLTYVIGKNGYSSPILQAQPYTIGVQIGISMR